MYRIEWLESALDELTQIWLEVDSLTRGAITSSVHEIETRLRTDPFRESESRPNDRRVLFAAPLGFTVRVDLRTRIVLVLRVWLFRRRHL